MSNLCSTNSADSQNCGLPPSPARSLQKWQKAQNAKQQPPGGPTGQDGHDSEDRLAQYVVERLKWNIQKQGLRWVGADYESILEQGGHYDVEQNELILAAAGRIHVALAHGQMHFDQMEESHAHMLGAVLAIILYHKADDPPHPG